MATEGWKRFEYQTTGYLNLNSSVITATISWASPWKSKWFQMHREHCFILKSNSFKSILIGDSLIAGLNRYCKIWNNFFKPIEAFNCDIGGDKVQMFYGTHRIYPVFLPWKMLSFCVIPTIYTRTLQRI